MHTIMTIEEVAAFLRVSERTVYDWAQKGDLPGGKLGTTWRFKRMDIESWVDKRLGSKDKHAKAAATTSQVLSPERIILPGPTNKKAVLESLVDLLAETPFVTDRTDLLQKINDREKLMSTGIGCGIGVPHVRIDSVTDLVMAMAVSAEPINDYHSLDSEPVHIVCMLAARADQHGEYIRSLSGISSRLKSEATRQQLIDANDPLKIFGIMTAEGIN